MRSPASRLASSPRASSCLRRRSPRTSPICVIAGLAEEIVGTGRWRLTPKLIQIAVAFQFAVEQAERKLGEMKQRYTRTPA
jgi:hypothetical protein